MLNHSNISITVIDDNEKVWEDMFPFSGINNSHWDFYHIDDMNGLLEDFNNTDFIIGHI